MSVCEPLQRATHQSSTSRSRSCSVRRCGRHDPVRSYMVRAVSTLPSRSWASAARSQDRSGGGSRRDASPQTGMRSRRRRRRRRSRAAGGGHRRAPPWRRPLRHGRRAVELAGADHRGLVDDDHRAGPSRSRRCASSWRRSRSSVIDGYSGVVFKLRGRSSCKGPADDPLAGGMPRSWAAAQGIGVAAAGDAFDRIDSPPRWSARSSMRTCSWASDGSRLRGRHRRGLTVRCRPGRVGDGQRCGSLRVRWRASGCRPALLVDVDGDETAVCAADHV